MMPRTMAIIGGLAFAFSDSFWFNAVEAEVYALSMFFTAVVIWLALRWAERHTEAAALKYLLLIAYFIGLAIGVHLLNVLAIPAVAYLEAMRWRGPALAAYRAGVKSILFPAANVKDLDDVPEDVRAHLELVPVESMDEVFALADRCHVLYRGEIVAGWSRDEFDREQFGLAMGGVYANLYRQFVRAGQIRE